MIEITDEIFISEDELVFKVSRSSGPGGQNVNKVNTRVTLLFDLANNKSFNDEQKQRMLKCLKKRVDKAGTLRVVSQKYRTQRANRKAAVERLRQILLESLKTQPVRRKTKMPYAAKLKRLGKKKHRSLLKQRRAKRHSAEDLFY
jgi:ribosome-associated protein